MKLDRRTAINAPLLKLEEERELVRRWQTEGCTESRERLILSHARMAFSIAGMYSSGNEEAINDLAQHGLMALMHATNKFQPSFGKRFAGYSELWIRAYVSQAAAGTLLVVDVPARKYLDIRMGRAKDEKVSNMAAFGESSFDAPVNGGEGLTLGDVMESRDPTPADYFEADDREDYFRRSLKGAMALLSEREQKVLQLRRLNDPGATLEEVGLVLRVTRERVRQIEKAAMDKIRKHLAQTGFTAEALN